VLHGKAADLADTLEPGSLFEWIAARHPFRDLSANALSTALDSLDCLAAPDAQLRLLFSQPTVGPAAALLAMADLPDALRQLLAPLPALEQAWLSAPPDRDLLQAELERRGWTVNWQQWQEPLELTLTAGVIERWLGDDAAYQRHLSDILQPKQLRSLQETLQQRLGSRLPQQLQHQRLTALRRR